MLCVKCHANLLSLEQPCPKCGHLNQVPLNWIPPTDASETSDLSDQPDATFLVIGALLPIVGLFLFYSNKPTAPRKAQSALRGTIWGLAAYVIFLFLTIATRHMPDQPLPQTTPITATP